MTAGRLRERRALVHGGGSGIGRASAVRLAADCAAVAVADIRHELAEATAAAITAAGGTASWSACDIADEDQVAAATRAAVEAPIVVFDPQPLRALGEVRFRKRS